MSLWLVRAGKHGEHEDKFFDDERIYLNWPQVQDHDLKDSPDRDAIKDILRPKSPGKSEQAIGNWTGQILAFVNEMQQGDIVVVPRKRKPAIAVGEIAGDHEYDANAEPLYRHSRPVKWLNLDIPRTAFDRDLLYAFQVLTTTCQIEKNNAEKRVRAMLKLGKKKLAAPVDEDETDSDADTESPDDEELDLERFSRDQIARLIIQKLKGHGLELLVEAILKAQGYSTFHSPKGADKGVDILAAPGPLGFGQPRICGQVKATAGPIDRPTLDQLIGTMQNVNAQQGLLVSWGGFTSDVDRVTAQHFFKVRLWDQDILIDELLAN